MLNTIENKAKWLQTNCRPNRGCATLVRSKFRQKIFFLVLFIHALLPGLTLGLGSNSIQWEPLRNTWRSASQKSHMGNIKGGSNYGHIGRSSVDNLMPATRPEIDHLNLGGSWEIYQKILELHS